MELIKKLLICILMCIGCVRGSPGGFDSIFNGTSYYFFSHDWETWTGAVVSCQVLGGYLAELNTEQEYKFVKEASRQHESISRWIGLSDKRQAGVWEWATSHFVYDRTTFDMWATGELISDNGQTDESCVVLDKFNGDGKTHDFELADVPCNAPEKYICEYNTPQIDKLVFGK